MLNFVQFLTTGQKFDSLPTNSDIEALEAGHQTAQDIETTAEDDLWRMAKFLQFQFFDTRLSEANNKGPGEGQRQ